MGVVSAYVFQQNPSPHFSSVPLVEGYCWRLTSVMDSLMLSLMKSMIAMLLATFPQSSSLLQVRGEIICIHDNRVTTTLI